MFLGVAPGYRVNELRREKGTAQGTVPPAHSRLSDKERWIYIANLAELTLYRGHVKLYEHH